MLPEFFSRTKIIVGAIVVAILIAVIAIINPFVIINAGHRGVVLTWGAVSGKVLGEGLHLIIPVAQTVKEIEVRTVKMETSASAYSKDLQTITTLVALNYHVIPDSVNTLFQTIGLEYEARVVAPAVQEAVKAVTAKFTAQELIEQRAIIKDEIKLVLLERLTKNFLILDEFSITNFEFSDAYEKAVEAKQVAQQDALASKNKLEQVKFEAEQKVATAQAEAQAIKIQAQAITQQGGEDYVRLQAIKQWNGVLPTQMVPGSAVPFLNLSR